MDDILNEKPKKRKYIKLTGNEIITEKARKHAEEFSVWFSNNRRRLTCMIYSNCLDEDVMHDTYLHIYDCISYKGITIKDFKWYFLTSYYRKLIYKKQTAPLVIDIEDDTYPEVRTLTANQPDSKTSEETIRKINNEIMDYVRKKYGAVDFSIFEMYIKLFPEISYKKLSEMIDYPFNKVWPVMSQIRKDVVQNFKKRKDFLLSAD